MNGLYDIRRGEDIDYHAHTCCTLCRAPMYRLWPTLYKCIQCGMGYALIAKYRHGIVYAYMQ
jgi:hypothetical protein